jgi:nitroimidazol reductase NimA-like FMN-containing flavoprotein (pyridoxamine 5'-phosphate oxidase superfamily)
MRRKDKEIKEKPIIEEILRQNQVGRLGTCVNGVPYVVPMNYAYSNDRIYLHSHKEGKKVQDIRSNPNVCFEVDEGEIIKGDKPCDYSWKYYSVILNGEARIISDLDEKMEALKVISNKYAFGKSNLITKEIVEKEISLIVIVIDVQSMSGKRSPA